MKTLDLSFADAITYVLKEIAADNPTFAIRDGGNTYYSEKVLQEVENKTPAGEHFAQLILGIAIQLAMKEKGRERVVQNARTTAQDYMTRFKNIKLPDVSN